MRVGCWSSHLSRHRSHSPHAQRRTPSRGRPGSGGTLPAGRSARCGRPRCRLSRPGTQRNPVAVKVLREGLAVGERLAKEIAAARKVEPFCLAQVLDASTSGRPYIVAEYVDGPSLQQAGRHGGPELLRLAVATATALDAIHQAGVLHGDLTPSNVVLGPDGPRVVDFGIAVALGSGMKATSNIVGTPAYMAPEQLAGKPVGAAADVFSWASVLVFAATGVPPFGDDALPAVINRILNEEPQLGELGRPLQEIVAACLAKDPAARPAMRDVLLRLAAPSRRQPAPYAAPTSGAAPATGPAHGLGHGASYGATADQTPDVAWEQTPDRSWEPPVSPGAETAVLPSLPHVSAPGRTQSTPPPHRAREPYQDPYQDPAQPSGHRRSPDPRHDPRHDPAAAHPADSGPQHDARSAYSAYPGPHQGAPWNDQPYRHPVAHHEDPAQAYEQWGGAPRYEAAGHEGSGHEAAAHGGAEQAASSMQALFDLSSPVETPHAAPAAPEPPAYEQPAYEQTAYEQTAYEQTAYEQAAYEQTAYEAQASGVVEDQAREAGQEPRPAGKRRGRRRLRTVVIALVAGLCVCALAIAIVWLTPTTPTPKTKNMAVTGAATTSPRTPPPRRRRRPRRAGRVPPSPPRRRTTPRAPSPPTGRRSRPRARSSSSPYAPTARGTATAGRAARWRSRRWSSVRARR
ncbi:protein kinase [Nonomuraea antimicrobica]